METCPHGMTLGWCVACVVKHPDPYRAPKAPVEMKAIQIPHDHEPQVRTGLSIPETPA